MSVVEENDQYPRGFQPTPDSENPLYQLELPNFDGPLDLLLFLIKKHDMDIMDIPLAPLTARYLEHLDVMQNLNIDIAAGFLTLAAELAYIKSKMLVPQAPSEDVEEEEQGDPRADLVRRLLEYQKYKDAGAQLQGRDVLGRDSFGRSAAPEAQFIDHDAPLAEVPLVKLIEALDRVLKVTGTEMKHHVVVDNLSVADRLNGLIDRLRAQPTLSFSEMFTGMATRREIILTFLAILEVTKLKLVRMHQIEDGGDIFLRLVPEKLAEFDMESLPKHVEGSAMNEVSDEYR